jgi:hypothetical protein
VKTIRHTATLFFYDGAQIIEGRDEIGGHYLGVLVDPLDGKDRYLVTGAKPERLREFREGLADLRAVLCEMADSGWYLASVEEGLEAPLRLELQEAPLESSGFLPDEGFVLHDRPASDLSVREARARNNFVLELSVDPPEAAEEHRIRIETLAGLLTHVQKIVKHAYGAALRELSLSARRAIDRSDAHLLDVVVPAATGSFRVVLEGARQPDLVGDSELRRAFERVDALFENVGDPRRTIEVVKTYRGHLAGAYLRLLRFLVSNRTGLRYSWAQPTFSSASHRGITQSEAEPLLNALSGISNLGAESVTIEGALKKADVDTGAWRVATLDGDYSGKIKENGPSLAGLKLENSYRFSCVEEIEEVEGTGREQRTLFLTEHEPL